MYCQNGRSLQIQADMNSAKTSLPKLDRDAVSSGHMADYRNAAGKWPPLPATNPAIGAAHRAAWAVAKAKYKKQDANWSGKEKEAA